MNNNYIDLFVPYFLSVKLKEVGFDEPCLGYSYANMTYGDLYLTTSSFEITNELEHFYVRRPVWSQIFEWFSKTYKLHSHIRMVGINKYEAVIYNYADYFDETCSFKISNFSTVRDAEIACLEKLIGFVS